MSKTVKDLVSREIKHRFEGVNSAFVVDLTGLDVKQQEKVRRMLGGRRARLQVVKNSLARRAFAGGALEPLGAALQGPCALVTSADSLVEAAKVLVEAVKEFANLKLKQAIYEGDPDLLTVEQLSKLKTRRDLVGEIAMLVSSPGRAVAGCLSSPQAKIAGCVKAMIEKAA
jgi:large subunit ribosomal protein L10